MIANFSIGDLIIKPDVAEKLQKTGTNAFALLKRHIEGDRGDFPTDYSACVNTFGAIVSRYRFDEATFIVVTIPGESTVITLEEVK